MRRHTFALLPLATLAAGTLAAPVAWSAPGHHDGPAVVSQNEVTNHVDGVYRGQKFVYATQTGYPQGAPAGTVATLLLDEDTPVYSHGKHPVATVVDQRGRDLGITVTTVEKSETEFAFTTSQPLPRHARVQVRALVVADAKVDDEVSTTLVAGQKRSTDTDVVTVMPKVSAIDKTFTDGRSQARPGDVITYTAHASFTGEVIDGATLLVKQSALAPITQRPTLEVRDGRGRLVTIDPERLLYSKFGDSAVLTVLGGVPQGSTFTVRARATVLATATPGSTITTEFGVGLNNWAGGKLVRAVDTTTVA